MNKLERIWIKRMKRGPMDPVDKARVVAGKGIVGNANQGGRRQVTILSAKHWQQVTSFLDDAPDPRERRANLMVSDVDFTNSHGSILKIGNVRVRIYGETRPCEQMEKAAPGLKAAMQVPFGGGAFGEILDDGEIAIGDPVVLETP
jgi:MOSC domain-containing protein YiiM